MKLNQEMLRNAGVAVENVKTRMNNRSSQILLGKMGWQEAVEGLATGLDLTIKALHQAQKERPKTLPNIRDMSPNKKHVYPAA